MPRGCSRAEEKMSPQKKTATNNTRMVHCIHGWKEGIAAGRCCQPQSGMQAHARKSNTTVMEIARTRKKVLPELFTRNCTKQYENVGILIFEGGRGFFPFKDLRRVFPF